MLKSLDEQLGELARAIRARRVAQGWSQREMSERCGVPERTYRRVETRGEGSITHLVEVAVALRCEDNLALLFPAPAAASMDELLARQAAALPKPRRRPARRRTSP